MSRVRFEPRNPGDGTYRSVDCKLASFGENRTSGWLHSNKITQLEALDISRQPPLMSHARGLITRFQMDKVDGINVLKVLATNPGFYSQKFREEGVADINEGAAILSYGINDVGAEGNSSGGTQDGDGKTGVYGAGKTKTSVRQKIRNVIRRLCCIKQ